MKVLVNVKLSQHKYKTPEGYLVCQDAILSRTGKQTYMKSEIYPDCDDDGLIDVDRKPEDVFNEQTLASFEGKPITCEHPDVNVGPENYAELAVGHVHNIRRSKVDGQDVMIGDLFITDAQCIEDIENGIRTDLSCGYDCDITGGNNPCQINIRGNHIALCEEGRAGIARIIDSNIIDRKADVELDNIDVDNYVEGKNGVWYAKAKDENDLLTKLFASYDNGKTWYTCYLWYKQDRREKNSTQIGKAYFATSWTAMPRTSIGRNVATWYIGNHIHKVDYDYEIDHIDNNYKNDNLSNLQRITKQENLEKERLRQKGQTWVKPVEKDSLKDSASKGTLIQEFGKQGDQYKITKIDGNVIYAEELTTKKIVLFHKDKEGVEWAAITKSEVNDSIKDANEEYDDPKFNELAKVWKDTHIEYEYLGFKPLSGEYANYFKVSDMKKAKELALVHFEKVGEKDGLLVIYTEVKSEVKDSSILSELDNIKSLLNNIKYDKIKSKIDRIFIKFSDKENFKAALNILLDKYDVSSKEKSNDEFIINVYEKLNEKDTLVEDSNYSKKFYSNAIEELQKRQNKNNKEETLDENNFMYQKKKLKLNRDINKTISKYLIKLEED